MAGGEYREQAELGQGKGNTNITAPATVDKLKLQNGACLSIWGGPTAPTKIGRTGKTIDKPALRLRRSNPHAQSEKN